MLLVPSPVPLQLLLRLALFVALMESISKRCSRRHFKLMLPVPLVLQLSSEPPHLSLHQHQKQTNSLKNHHTSCSEWHMTQFNSGDAFVIRNVHHHTLSGHSQAPRHIQQGPTGHSQHRSLCRGAWTLSASPVIPSLNPTAPVPRTQSAVEQRLAAAEDSPVHTRILLSRIRTHQTCNNRTISDQNPNHKPQQ